MINNGARYSKLKTCHSPSSSIAAITGTETENCNSFHIRQNTMVLFIF